MNRADGQNLPAASHASINSAAALCDQAREHLAGGRMLDAQLCCQQALAADPACAEAMHLMGTLSLRGEQIDHAVEWFSRAARQDTKSVYLIGLGDALKRQGRREEACRVFDQAAAFDNGALDAWRPLAGLLADLGRRDEAAFAFRHVLKLDPADADAAYQAGFLAFLDGKLEEALGLLARAEQLRPNHAPTLQMRALVLQKLGRHDEAGAGMSRAHGLDPGNADICNDLGIFLRQSGRHEEALAWFERAVQLRPDFVLAHNNKAYSLAWLHRFDEALAVYAALKQADPDNAEPDWNAGLLHLLTGNFEAGWRGREARWKVPGLPIKRGNFSQPMWLGETPLAGKTILIHQDEGLGDVIQFVRYVPMMAALGARVLLHVDDPLVPLLAKLPGVSQCIARSANTFAPFDTYCGIASLPLAFDTRLETIPAGVPYLPAPDAARVQTWEQRLGPHHKMRVGLVWSGNPAHKADQHRSLSLRALLPLLDLDATFVSLQKDARPEDRATLRERPDIVDLTLHLTDFVETAALLSCLDLVITVDTSMAHLAGALARPVWILLQHTPDWRWLLDRDDSPWYPTARLFRQNESRDYAGVIARVRSELSARIAKSSATGPAAPVSEDADTLHRQGLLALGAGRHDEAVASISRAIRLRPQPLYLTSLGTALLAQGRRDDALAVFDKAVQLKPGDAGLWHNLGLALADAGCIDDAILSLQQALKLEPGLWDAANKAAILLHQAARFEEALVYFNRCDELKPDHIQTIGLRSETLQTLCRYEESLGDLERVHVLDPTNADALNKLGNCLASLDRYEEALSWYDKAIALRDRYALRNKAVALEQLGRFDEAAAAYRQAIADDPGDAGAEWNLALLQLLTGDFEAGWAGREAARWRIPVLVEGYPKLSRPIWRGTEPIDGKTILVCPDEGLGDVIQFARYVPMLAARGARVILIVQDELHPLLSRLPGVTQCLPRSATTAPPYDVHCPLTSLPLAFGTRLDTIPAETSYLPAPPPDRVKAWEERLGSHGRLRVGLVWSGNPRHPRDRSRSLPFRTMARILDADATFVSLQKDPRAEDIPALRERTEIIDLTAHLTDFVETAALVSCLDLVISVDTSVAHLSAALGRPTWILLPHTPDYRWLLDRDDSPWYPTVRLFRQDETRDYAEVIARVKAALQARIAARSPANAIPVPQSAAALFFNAALAQAHAGQLAEARCSCEQVLALDPAHAETLHLLGLLALGERLFDAALEFLSRAIRSDPKPLYLTSLGTALLGQGRRGEAVQAFDKAVQLEPENAELWRHLGGALVEAARPADAIEAFQQALKLKPDYLDVVRELSLLLYQAERHEDALAHFDLSATLSPDHFPTHYMRALTLQQLGRLEDALADNAHAHVLDPGNADVCYNMGNVLRLLQRHREALDWYDKSLALRPNFAAALSNRAVVLTELRRFDEAIASYRAATTADPQHMSAEWNLALLQLLLGDFESGWRGQEARWKVPPMSSRAPDFAEPKWLGAEPVAGKTVLVWANEGLGDVIQFVRYVPMLAGRGARVALVVPDPLRALLSGVDGVAQCLPTSAAVWPERDYHLPLSSLPLAFGTRLDTIPAKPYLPAPAVERVAAWSARLGAHDRLRVGLVWSGNVNHNNDRNRSLPLRALAPLLELEARFVSLQKDPRPDDAAFLREQPGIIDLTADLADFTDTAALIAALDLVVTVDTSVAHLSAALGRPTWILLPFTPDWRWLLDRDDSPWYSSARLFRQDERRDYESVIARVRAELAKAIAAWQGT